MAQRHRNNKVIRIRKSKKCRQYYGQKRYKGQTMMYKHYTDNKRLSNTNLQNPGVNPCVPDG